MKNTSSLLRMLVIALASGFAAERVCAQATPSAVGGPRPNLVENIARPLRYHPEGGDFVIENGAETFNRPLYGGGTFFRVDGGDKPEFVLYLPGRGGNLRLGITGPAGTKWIQSAAYIQTRYRPGELIYEIRDPVLGEGTLRVEAVAYAVTEGLVLRIESKGVAKGVEFVWAFGGINGERGARDGDIGTERVPISQWFQLKPEFAAGNTVAIEKHGFRITAPQGVIVGTATGDARLTTSDANAWGDLTKLLAAAGKSSDQPVALGRVMIPSTGPVFLSLQRVKSGKTADELDVYRAVRATNNPDDRAIKTPKLLPAFTPKELSVRFEQARSHFERLRGQVRIDTPDPYINAAMGALNVGAEATWDGPQQAVMHGAIAWRAKLLGWRGAYWLDALGYTGRADHHFRYWAKGQNISPIPDVLPPPDEASNLARSETALHSNGDISNSHYDMNTVFIDALFRHLEWTDDLELARDLWPVIERHLAWERRLFRRTYGPENLPLYEAYAVIWASDDLYYNGGGATHSSAYQYYHNKMAAKVARLIGKDPTQYLAEAEAIRKGMQAYLWMPETGAFAEYKDLLGRQRIHPNFGLWTYYLAVDSKVATPQEAWQMSTALQTLPFIPIKGERVPGDADYGMYSTTDWMPYSWSINNVVTQENLHTALALWESGREEDAFTLTKSAFLASMFMGISPGNMGTLAWPDVYRRESQRDFADSAGVTARTLVEGLFGLRPAALDKTLVIRPGFPESWQYASINHPVTGYAFKRDGNCDRWTLKPGKKQFEKIILRLPAPRDTVSGVTINGVKAVWTPVKEAVGRPEIEIIVSGGKPSEVLVYWSGAVISPSDPKLFSQNFERVSKGNLTWLIPMTQTTQVPKIAEVSKAATSAKGTLEPQDMTTVFNDAVSNIFFKNKYRSPRPPGVSLTLPAQGLGAWAGHVNQMAVIDDTGLRRASAKNGGQITTPDGVVFRTPAQAGTHNILFTSLWDNYPEEASMPVSGHAIRAYLLMAGTTNSMQSRFDNGEIVATYTDGATTRLALRNPDNWWPIEQDYFIDDYQFRYDASLPRRINLATGEVRVLDPIAFKGRGREIPGGAATVLDMPLDDTKNLASITVRATANEVVIGLMAITLERPQ